MRQMDLAGQDGSLVRYNVCKAVAADGMKVIALSSRGRASID